MKKIVALLLAAAMVLGMPVSWFWVNYVLPLVAG